MAVLSGAERDNLPDSAFAYIEPGGKKDSSGRTTPRSLRHFPVHDEAHVRAALSRIGQGAQFSEQARAKVMARARELGIEHDGHDGHDGDGSDGDRSLAEIGVERRYLGSHAKSTYRIGEYRLEARSDDDGRLHIGGHAAVFNRNSRNLGGFVEQVGNRAFERAQLDGFPGAVCRYNHNDMVLLGTVEARTLHLRTDSVGLPYDVILPKSRSDIAELVERGDVKHSSFAFKCRQDDWGLDRDTGYPRRVLTDVHVIDVAPVGTTPAYAEATAGLRSLAAAMDASEEEVRSLAEEDELRRFFVRTDNRGPARPKPKPIPYPAEALAQLMARERDPWADIV